MMTRQLAIIISEHMNYAFYVSRALVGKEGVERIVAAAREANPLKGLSGGMLFTGHFFAQFLEGPAPQLEATMAAISVDDRHSEVLRLEAGEEPRRQFARWTMGYIHAPQADKMIEDLLKEPADAKKSGLLRLLLKEWISGGV